VSDPNPQPDPATPFPWISLVAVAVAVAVVHQIPLFGVDREALFYAYGSGAAKLPIYLSPLALAGFAASPLTNNTGGRALLIFAVLASGWIGWTQLSWLSDPPMGLDTLVIAPGLGLRALVVLTLTAAHAILLWLATRLEGPRIHGLWWVVGAAWVVQWLPHTGEAWWNLAVQEPSAAFVYGLGLLPALGAATLWALLDAEHRWVRSWADAGALALLPAAVVDGLWAGLGDGISTGGYTFLAVALVLPGSALAALAARHRRGFAPLPGLPLALLGGLTVGGFLLWGATTSRDAFEIMVDRGPFYGEMDGTVGLHSDDPGPDDLEVLDGRLESLGIDATVEGRGGDAVVHLRRVSSVEVVLDAVLPRRAFSLRSVVEEGHDEPVDVVLQDCTQDPCQAMSLGVPRLDARHIDEASLRLNDYGEPQVLIHFTGQGGALFGDWTEGMVRKRIAIVLDEQVVSAPMVLERIAGGSAVIDMGRKTEDSMADARALTAALGQAPLQGHWTVR